VARLATAVAVVKWDIHQQVEVMVKRLWKQSLDNK
jgi:hypothetical protein